VRAACTRDDDCKNGLVCVRGQCAANVDPGALASGPLKTSDRLRRACVQKCDQAHAKCVKTVQSVQMCLNRVRKDCSDKCQAGGASAATCKQQCTKDEYRAGWSQDCAKQGDAGRETCFTDRKACGATCVAQP
jgi:hypothetical protein